MYETTAILLALIFNLAVGIGLHSLPHETMRSVGGLAGMLLLALLVGAFFVSVSSGIILLLIVVVSGWLLAPAGRTIAAKLRGFDVSAEQARELDQTVSMIHNQSKDEIAINDPPSQQRNKGR